MEYQTEQIKVNLKTMPTWCFFFRPFSAPYDKLNKENKTGGPMWEKSVFIGRGWIGVIDENGDKQVKGEFKSYTYKGPYSGLSSIFREIMKENPKAKDYYTLYINNPNEVEESELETKILFR